MTALSESSPYMRAQANLSELKLDQICAAMPDYIRMVADGERDFAQAMAEMTASEVAARRERIMRQRIRSSGFPYAKTLADFDWSFQPSVPRAKVEELATLRFMDEAENILLVGSPGVGKTHLANAIGIKIKERYPEKRVLYVAAHEFQVQYTDSVRNNTFNNFINFYQSIDVLILDDVQEFASASLVKTQDTFFHIFNYLHQNRKQLILTCDRPPVKLQGMTDRLLSRFKWGLLAEISRPDVALRKEVIHSKVHRDGLHFSEEVINYIAENVDESVRDLEGIITSLMARAAVFNRDPDLTMAENLVRRLLPFRAEPAVRIPVQIRQIAMYLSQKYTDTSLSRIGTMIGKRNHATVLHATKIISGLLENDKQLQKDMQEIEALVKQR